MKRIKLHEYAQGQMLAGEVCGAQTARSFKPWRSHARREICHGEAWVAIQASSVFSGRRNGHRLSGGRGRFHPR